MKILASAPARISLIGGGTDIASFSTIYCGAVISMAINIRSHIALQTRDDIYEIGNSMPHDADPQLIYEILQAHGINGMHHSKFQSSFDGIIGAGLGSSASIAVCVLSAIAKVEGKELDRSTIAEEAYDIEVNKLGWFGGRQDQYASVYGGFNYIEFGKQVKVYPFERESIEWLLPYLMLFYIGGTRKSPTIQRGFKQLTIQQIDKLKTLKAIVPLMQEAIVDRNVNDIAMYLHDSWVVKRLSNENVSNDRIDGIYEYGIASGALAGKLLGAGGCGYLLFICNPSDQKGFITAMKKKGIENIDFSLDFNGVDVRIIST